MLQKTYQGVTKVFPLITVSVQVDANVSFLSEAELEELLEDIRLECARSFMKSRIS